MVRTEWRRNLVISSFALVISSCGGQEILPASTSDQPSAAKTDESGSLPALLPREVVAGQLRFGAIESLQVTDLDANTTEVIVTFLRRCNDSFIELTPNKLPAIEGDKNLARPRMAIGALVRETQPKESCFAIVRERRTLVLPGAPGGYSLVKLDGTESAKLAKIGSMETTTPEPGKMEVTVTYLQECGDKLVTFIHPELPGDWSETPECAAGVLMEKGTSSCLGPAVWVRQTFSVDGEWRMTPIATE